MKLADRLIYKEKYKGAIEKLKGALEQNENNADAWNLLGFASRKSGDTDAAGIAYSKALSLNEHHLGALEYQGELFITLGKMEEAKMNLNKLNKLCPSGCEELDELTAAIAAVD